MVRLKVLTLLLHNRRLPPLAMVPRIYSKASWLAGKAVQDLRPLPPMRRVSLVCPVICKAKDRRA